jgi:hypothetical protein
MDKNFMDEKLDFHGIKFIQKIMVVRREIQGALQY